MLFGTWVEKINLNSDPQEELVVISQSLCRWAEASWLEMCRGCKKKSNRASQHQAGGPIEEFSKLIACCWVNNSSPATASSRVSCCWGCRRSFLGRSLRSGWHDRYLDSNNWQICMYFFQRHTSEYPSHIYIYIYLWASVTSVIQFWRSSYATLEIFWWHQQDKNALLVCHAILKPVC